MKLRAGGARIVTTGEGNGPVNAIDHALRQAISQLYPEIVKFELIDYKVRILDQGHGTDAITRVLIETSDGLSSWVTVGVGHNVIEASWRSLIDSFSPMPRLVSPDAARSRTSRSRSVSGSASSLCLAVALSWLISLRRMSGLSADCPSEIVRTAPVICSASAFLST